MPRGSAAPRAAVAEADVASAIAPSSVAHRAQPRAVGALLGLLLEDVVEPVEQDAAIWSWSHSEEQRAIGAVGERDQRVERDELADRQLRRR